MMEFCVTSKWNKEHHKIKLRDEKIPQNTVIKLVHQLDIHAEGKNENE
jgi:hypothetical protein